MGVGRVDTLWSRLVPVYPSGRSARLASFGYSGQRCPVAFILAAWLTAPSVANQRPAVLENLVQFIDHSHNRQNRDAPRAEQREGHPTAFWSSPLIKPECLP
jgi:hypothetical protein